uniref:Coiled-coil domain containing 195 n=1 Tax=Panthera tigris altaica TaxID=74533 RepID=A0A8C9M5C5_PANTA
MDANSQFLRIIQEMRAEISKLKKENQFLRMTLTSSTLRTSGGPCRESGDQREEEASEKSPATLYSAVSTDAAPAGREHQGNVMIVRRYSISSPVHSFAAHDLWKAGARHPKSGILDARGRVKPPACFSIKKEDKEEEVLAADSLTNSSSNGRAFPERGFGNVTRDKMKTVSFLLPVDVSSYSKNSSSLKCSQNQTTNQLSTIAE